MTPTRDDLSFQRAIELFIADAKSEGRMTSKHTERAYREKLSLHGEDLGNHHPAVAVRADIRTTLRRWENPTTQAHAHAILSSFYAWCVEEELRRDNPVAAVRRPKKRQAVVYRMTPSEVRALLDASKSDERDKWVAHLGVCAGLRSQELLGVQGRHFDRKGFVWVSGALGKGGKERWIPVIADLAPVVDEIRGSVGTYERVVAPRKFVGRPTNAYVGFERSRSLTHAALYKQVIALGRRAGVAGRVTPHTLRHAFGDLVARQAGLRVAQALMGHASVTTTVGYTEAPSLDELASAVDGLRLPTGPRSPDND